jgi:putative endopeptidase
MDLSVRNADGKEWIQPTLNRIAAIKSKQDLAGVVAFLHLNYPGEWTMSPADDNFARQALFAFASGQDLENASMQVPFIDQGGMALPALDYYLKDDAHYQDLRTKYVAHVRKMLEMIGEPSDKAAADACRRSRALRRISTGTPT